MSAKPNQAVGVEVARTGICVLPEHGPRRACPAGGQVFKYQEVLTHGQQNRLAREAWERQLHWRSADVVTADAPCSADLEKRALAAALARE